MFCLCDILFPDRRHDADDENKPDAHLSKASEKKTMARPTKNTEAMGAKSCFRLPLNLDIALRDEAKAKGLAISDVLRLIVESHYAPKVSVTQVTKPAKAKAKAKAKA